MRIAVLTLPLMLLASCSMFSGGETKSEFTPPNSLMADEIESRVQQIPYQHRDELLQNLMWLSQTGEPTIPSLLKGLKHESPKVRSSCAWTLGRIRDRRTIPHLQAMAKDTNETVRLEVARTLLSMGDMQQCPTLIEGLDSEKKEVRYLCHEALKGSTGRDFGYDHLSDNTTQRRSSVLGWRTWWSDYSGDPFFATNYQQKWSLNPAQPSGETSLQQEQPMPQEQPIQQDGSEMPSSDVQNNQIPVEQPAPTPSNGDGQGGDGQNG